MPTTESVLMTRTTAAEIIRIKARIAELATTPRALVGSDSGTHGQPDRHDIYEEITGERYATYSFAGSNATRCTEEQALADTHGRIRYFPNSQAGIRESARELKELMQQLRKINSEE